MYKLFIWDLCTWPLYRSCPFFRGGRYEGFHCIALYAGHRKPSSITASVIKLSAGIPVDTTKASL